MSDRDAARAEAMDARRETHDDETRDVRRPVGEEIDPDSTVEVPYVDEDGEVVDPEEIDALGEDH